MSTTPATTKFWQGTNFWVTLTIAAGSIWGLTEADVTPVVTSAFGVLGGAFAIREKIKNTTVNWVAWISSPNTWTYIFAAVAAVVPSLPAGLGPKVSEVITSVIGKNWPAAISATLSLLAMFYFIITGGKGLLKTKAEPAATAKK